MVKGKRRCCDVACVLVSTECPDSHAMDQHEVELERQGEGPSDQVLAKWLVSGTQAQKDEAAAVLYGEAQGSVVRPQLTPSRHSSSYHAGSRGARESTASRRKEAADDARLGLSGGGGDAAADARLGLGRGGGQADDARLGLSGGREDAASDSRLGLGRGEEARARREEERREEGHAARYTRERRDDERREQDQRRAGERREGERRGEPRAERRGEGRERREEYGAGKSAAQADNLSAEAAGIVGDLTSEGH